MDEYSVTEREARPYVGVRGTVTQATVASVAHRVPELFGWVATHGGTSAGPPFFRYHLVDMDGEMVVEVGVPVAAPLEGDGDVTADTLPSGRYAVARHVGSPSTLVAATAGLLDWAKGQGLRFDVTGTPDGERWACRVETYETDPTVEPETEKWVTELAFRLADG